MTQALLPQERTTPKTETNYLRLTTRWHPLRFHSEQSRAWHHPARFKTIHAGRRSGKTEIFGKRKRVLWLWDCLVNPRPWPSPRSFIAAPTRDQAKKIYWGDIKALTPRAWIQSISTTDLTIVTRWGAELTLIGLDKPARIEGIAWDDGTVDEIADCKPGIFDAHIRPAIADRIGSVDFLGVPDMNGPSQVEYEKMCERGRMRKDQEWADFAWGSDGILPAEEIESMRSIMDPRLFEQETSGRFILPGGRAFPDYDVAVHVKDEIAAYDPALPICWALDFNVDPMCSGVIQHSKGEVRVLDEIVIPDTITDVACSAFLERAKSRRWNLDNLTIYGDASGNQRRSSAKQSGYTDWLIVQNHLRSAVRNFTMKVPPANPPIPDTRNAVNAKLKNAAGKATLFINSRCRQLQDDFRSLLWPSDLSSGHCLAWLRYFVTQEYPVKDARPMQFDRSDFLSS